MLPTVLLDGAEIASEDISGVKTFHDLGLPDSATITLNYQDGPIPYRIRQSIQVNLWANSGLLFRGEIVGVSPGRRYFGDGTLELRCRNKQRASNSTANNDQAFIESVYQLEYPTRDERYAEVTVDSSRERVNMEYDLSWTKDIPLKSRKDRFIGKIMGVDRDYARGRVGPNITLRMYTGKLPPFRGDSKAAVQRPVW